MKRLSLYSVAVSLAILSACADQPTAPQQLKSNVSKSLVSAASARQLVAFKSTSGIPADFAASVTALGGSVAAELSGIGGAIVTGLSADAVALLLQDKNVLAVEAEEILPYKTQAVTLPETVDPSAEVNSQAQPQTAVVYARQWNLRAVNAPAAWAAGHTGSSAVRAAILDTGIDYALPDLAGLVDLGRSKSFVPQEDAVVAAVFPGKNPITDLDGHGTNVASQVSSKSLYLAGVTTRTTLMGVKVCSLVLEGCPNAAVLNGILYAVDQGADVINMSLGGGFLKHHNGAYGALLNRVFQYAEQAGVTVVVAAGNSQADMDHATNVHFTYCNQTHVICVSATGATQAGAGNVGPFDDADQFAGYSNFGRSRVDVAAPGGNYTLTPAGQLASAAWVWSLCPRTMLALVDGKLYYTACSAFPANLYLNGYAGTSQASPHVAGLASLLVAQIGRHPAQIRARIARGADDLGQPGVDPYFGSGRINVAKTLGL